MNDDLFKDLREQEKYKRVQLAKKKLFSSEVSNKKTNIFINTEDKQLIPMCATEGSAGYDLFANANITIRPNETILVPTGIKIQLPNYLEAQIRPRSSSFLKGLLVCFGTIDSDFRGEICVIVRNMNNHEYHINKYDRVAQMCFATITKVQFKLSEKLSTTTRNQNGFGSTGK
jgi:dUTP pyrophosphatase